MDQTSVHLIDSKIVAIDCAGAQIKLRIEPAYLIKTMTGSVECTHWRQNADLFFTDAEWLNKLEPPSLPVECIGGDLHDNIYTYRDMLPVPLQSRGKIYCHLTLAKQQVIQIQAKSVTLQLEGVAQYIRHAKL